MSLINVKNLKKIYQNDGVETVALSGINLEINSGEFVAIIGPSGSGKSTLLQILGALDRPSSGQYFFDGKEISSYSDEELALVRNQKMGFVFQMFNLLPRQSVLENVKIPLIYSGVSEPQRTDRAKKFIAQVGLTDRENFATSKLSGGQKQRVAIARALVNEPKVIFADEPTGSLESRSGAIILKYLQDLHDSGHTIILVTHETYVAKCAQRTIHIKDGSIELDEKNEYRHLISEGDIIK
jgi:putative ABC transport system ATP-binding protein